MKTNKQKIQLLTAYALLAALVIVLQTFVAIPLGPFTVTLTLVPIMIGAILYGAPCGCFLGTVFGIVVAIQVVTGAMGPASYQMFEMLPAITMILCVFKGAAAGAVSGLIYRPFRKGEKKLLGTILSAVACPIVNTGIFVLGLALFYGKLVSVWAVAEGYTSVFMFLILGMVGLNFVVEFALNILLIPAVLRIIKAVKTAYSH